MKTLQRRQFVGSTCALTLAAGLAKPARAITPQHGMKFGLVTYLWGKDMKLAELLDKCEASGLLGVELRTQHAHGVEPSLSQAERVEIKKRFAASPVELVGYGSNCEFHSDDPKKLKSNIEEAKEYIRLMHDCGGSGVKVKPNAFPKNVSKSKTIEQIGKSLNVLAKYGEGFGQTIRVEVHGKGTSELPVIRDIFQVADHPNVGVCWNSNDVDLNGEGLETNFKMVQARFADTVHVRELDSDKYPYRQLLQLFKKIDYKGWILLEARTNPENKLKALIDQKKLFDGLLS